MYTAEDKMKLVTGQGTWHTNNLNGRLDAVWMSDGPHGLRAQNEKIKTNNKSCEATCFPTASALAASWDTELVSSVASAIADEALAEGISILLGPGTNMKRSPLCGRNFEYFSEDPYLAGKLAASYIKAVEAKNIGTSVKHFACNSQESNRMRENNQVDERTLHEIYLRAFEIAVKEGKPATIMASYNRINGDYACMNRELLTEILRKRWGFEGVVVSDWGACLDLTECVKAGMDIEMPGNKGVHLKKLKQDYTNEKITDAELDLAANRVLALIDKYGENKRKPMSPEDRRKLLSENHRKAVSTAVECAVLLKNDGCLPLKKDAELVIIGDLAAHTRFQGGGSSHINTSSCDSFLQVLENSNVTYQFARGYNAKKTEADASLIDKACELAANTSGPIIFCGGLTDLAEGEGYDRESLEMPVNQVELLKKLDTTIKNNKLKRDLIFLSFGGSPYNLAPAKNANAILHMYLAGEGSAEAAKQLLFGEKNPCGKLAETFPLSLADTPAHGNFGRVGDDICYKENLFIGYRYYDSFDIPVQFPFGYGLSYTQFEYSELEVEKCSNDAKEKTEITASSNKTSPYTKVKLKFNIKNTGSIAGKEIVQVYVKNPESSIMRAKKELRGFAKVFLEPGETKRVELLLDDHAFSVYDVESKAFREVNGSYELFVGASSTDIRLTEKLDINTEGGLNPGGETVKPHIYTDEEFAKVYGRPLSNFTNPKPGEFNLSNSIRQLAKYSFKAKLLKFLAFRIVDVMFFGKSRKDPEVRMVTETLLDGPIDVIVCQSGGAISMKFAESIVAAVNRKSKKQ